MGRACSAQGGMWPMGIIGIHIVPDHNAQFAGSLVFVDVDAVVFKSSKEAFCPGTGPCRPWISSLRILRAAGYIPDW